MRTEIRRLFFVLLVFPVGSGWCQTVPDSGPGPVSSRWFIAGSAPDDYQFVFDATASATGNIQSIAAKLNARVDGFGTLMQRIAADDYRGKRCRLSGYLRTDSAARAQMWLRVDGPDREVVAFDNMRSRPIVGTTDWTRYDIVLDVPTDGADIAFGFFLSGGGKVWGDNFKLEEVDSTVPVTASKPTLPRAPGT